MIKCLDEYFAQPEWCRRSLTWLRAVRDSNGEWLLAELRPLYGEESAAVADMERLLAGDLQVVKWCRKTCGGIPSEGHRQPNPSKVLHVLERVVATIVELERERCARSLFFGRLPGFTPLT